MRRLSLLKLLSVFSALFVFSPGETVTVPFAFTLIAFDYSSRIVDKLLSFIDLFSILFILVSVGLNWKSRLTDIITLAILISYVLYLASHWPDYMHHANWLSSITTIIALLIIFCTIREMAKRMSRPKIRP